VLTVEVLLRTLLIAAAAPPPLLLYYYYYYCDLDVHVAVVVACSVRRAADGGVGHSE